MPDPCQSCARCACCCCCLSDVQRGTHHTSSDQTSVQNSVVSQPSLNVYRHDGQIDPPVPFRECNSCGTSDVDQLSLHYSQHEQVQTVMGGVCPGVSGQDNDFAARGVSATDYQLFKSAQWHCNAQCAWGAGGCLELCWRCIGAQQTYFNQHSFTRNI